MTVIKAALTSALSVLLVSPSFATQQAVRLQAMSPQLNPPPLEAHGRVEPVGDGSFLRQWPRTYFETVLARCCDERSRLHHLPRIARATAAWAMGRITS